MWGKFREINDRQQLHFRLQPGVLKIGNVYSLASTRLPAATIADFPLKVKGGGSGWFELSNIACYGPYLGHVLKSETIYWTVYFKVHTSIDEIFPIFELLHTHTFQFLYVCVCVLLFRVWKVLTSSSLRDRRGNRFVINFWPTLICISNIKNWEI